MAGVLSTHRSRVLLLKTVGVIAAALLLVIAIYGVYVWVTVPILEQSNLQGCAVIIAGAATALLGAVAAATVCGAVETWVKGGTRE